MPNTTKYALKRPKLPFKGLTLTGTEAGTLSDLMSYGTYVLDFRLNGTLRAGITRPECCRFKRMELTQLKV